MPLRDQRAGLIEHRKVIDQQQALDPVVAKNRFPVELLL
jgi:hypothetical protein